ncbi:protein kinase [bacterium]|nr:protein kinase [bacterium]
MSERNEDHLWDDDFPDSTEEKPNAGKPASADPLGDGRSSPHDDIATVAHTGPLSQSIPLDGDIGDVSDDFLFSDSKPDSPFDSSSFESSPPFETNAPKTEAGNDFSGSLESSMAWVDSDDFVASDSLPASSVSESDREPHSRDEDPFAETMFKPPQSASDSGNSGSDAGKYPNFDDEFLTIGTSPSPSTASSDEPADGIGSSSIPDHPEEDQKVTLFTSDGQTGPDFPQPEKQIPENQHSVSDPKGAARTGTWEEEDVDDFESQETKQTVASRFLEASDAAQVETEKTSRIVDSPAGLDESFDGFPTEDDVSTDPNTRPADVFDAKSENHDRSIDFSLDRTDIDHFGEGDHSTSEDATGAATLPAGTPNPRGSSKVNFESRDNSNTFTDAPTDRISPGQVDNENAIYFPEDGISGEIRTIPKGETIRSRIEFVSGDTFLNKYRMIRQLGSVNSRGQSTNGMGVVWVAEHIGLHSKRVLKFLRPDLCNSSMIKRFLREAMILARIKHNSVVAINDFAFQDGYVFIDMEYVEGDTLTKFLESQPYRRMNRVDLIWFLSQISEVLELFRKNEPYIVHRDLKPDNLMIVTSPDGSKRLKVLDFGVAKVFDPEIAVERTDPVHQIFLGTPLYMSPEQCAGENAALDCRSDIYSLGIILYQAITGSRPFRGKTNDVLFKAHLKQPPPFFSETVSNQRAKDPLVPDLELPNLDRVQDIIFRMLEKNRDLRPACAAEAAEDLIRALKDESEDALRPVIEFDPDEVFLDRYRMIRPLGERTPSGELKNAMSVVWLAEHIRLKQMRVLKFLRPELGNTLNVSKFRQEGEILSRLNHPNIVTVHDADHTDGYAFIDMEYVDGTTFTDYLRKQPSGRLGPGDLLWFVGEMTDVLERLRKNVPAIVHQDLKPDNIMIVIDSDGEKHLKVIDFGIASFDRPNERSGDSEGLPVGTAYYMSPEQCAGEIDSLDVRSDIYSLGVILYEAVTGRRPFEAAQRTALFYLHQNESPPSFESLSRTIEKKDGKATKPIQLPNLPEIERIILKKAMAKDRRDRPATAAELRLLFENALVSPKLGENPVPTSWNSLVPAVAALILAAVVFAVQMGRGWLSTSPRSVDPAFIQATKPVLGYLSKKGFEPFDTKENAVQIGSNLWPIEIVENATKSSDKPLRLKLHQEWKIYLPAGWSPRSKRFDLDEQAKANDSPVKDYAAEYLKWEEDELKRLNELRPDLPPLIFHKDSGIVCRLILGTESTGFLYGKTEDKQIRLLSDYYLQETEFTNRQFSIIDSGGFEVLTNRISGEILPDKTLEKIASQPVVGISYREAVELAGKIGALLPTTTQWEYAARSLGDDRKFVWSGRGLQNETNPIHKSHLLKERLSNVMVYREDRTDQLIFDMTGNVSEWVRDYVPEINAAIQPPMAKDDFSDKNDTNSRVTFRGGSFLSDISNAETTFVGPPKTDDFDNADQGIGFRIVLDVRRYVPVDKALPPENPGN